ncbi:MAG: sigma-54-dependent Fis family transcriptional regulator [Deltaproteobacteria bacterium]|nr:sigma-54-dependent Fis family transcriptional regulator [Deltaproteobacteria bacterium]
MTVDGARILVIEDEPAVRNFVADSLRGAGHAVDEAPDGDAGIALARRNDYALVLTDLRMPGLSGIDLVRALRAIPDAPEVVVLTAYGSVATAVEAMKAGALDFIEKPASGPDQVRLVAERAVERRRLQAENERLKGATARTPAVRPVVADPAMAAVMDRVRRVAPTDTTVLLLGESGVGKEVVAREVHRLRHGDRGPFVAVNCAALPEALLESELFGHEKGAFTGAAERKVGLVEAASGGTLFLDEVAEMPVALQPKLLRVLETREFTRVGGVRTLTTTARFVAATNRDIAAAVEAGRFRSDLFYRLSVFPVTVPPLRERPADVTALAGRFLETARVRLSRPDLVLSEAALAACRAYEWPGNARELRNAVERACILADGPEVRPADLGLAEPASPAGGDAGALAAVERETILRVVRECGGNRRAAASRLGISLRTLQYRLKEYGEV